MLETAIIGGTGVYDPDLLNDTRETIVETEYGQVKVVSGSYQETEVAFIPRHGSTHSVPPHLVNYRANIMALHQMGIKNIIATAAVGSLNFEYKPGFYVLADQFLDFTKMRKNTFFEGGEKGVVHCDMTVPYCPEVRQALMTAGREMGLKIVNGGVYVCTEGPRFETAAEINMFKMLGGQLIGMTSVPEVCLARELGMCYANISIVTNFAAGISTSILTHSEVVEMMGNSIHEVRRLIMSGIKNIPAAKNCSCANILSEAGINK
jgi:5'-methylthioadenosine phosphorylase